MLRWVGRAETQNKLVQHPCVEDKNWEEYLVSPEEQKIPFPRWAPDPTAPVLGREALTTSDCEKQWGFHPGKTEGSCRLRRPLQGPSQKLTGPQILALSSSKGIAALKAPESYREELNCLVSRWELEGSCLWDRNASRHLFPLLSAPSSAGRCASYPLT